MNDQFCNNCGKKGHLFHKCKIPIMSFGIIAFRFKEDKIQYLMICRRHSLGYIDFIRGKYSPSNYKFLLNLFKQMTIKEKEKISSTSFDNLWKDIWGGSNSPSSIQYKSELYSSRDKYNILKNGCVSSSPQNSQYYNLETLINESGLYDSWEDPEWGFPKGRRNYKETDIQCAMREFNEETGIDINLIKPIHNILPFDETFTGSNYKSYKHKYYIAYIDYDEILDMDGYERTEVSKMEWKTFDGCIDIIRKYNLEKIRMIQNVDKSLNTYKSLFF